MSIASRRRFAFALALGLSVLQTSCHHMWRRHDRYDDRRGDRHEDRRDENRRDDPYDDRGDDRYQDRRDDQRWE